MRDKINPTTKADYAYILLMGMLSGVRKLEAMKMLIRQAKNTHGKATKKNKGKTKLIEK